MTQTVPLWIFLLALVVGGVAVSLHKGVNLIVDSARRITEALVAATTASNRLETALFAASAAVSRLEAVLAPASTELQANMAAVPKLLEAVSKVGQAQLEVTQAQRAEFQKMKSNPFGRPNWPAAPRDVESANLEYEITQMMRSEGITREEALMRANPANSSSVWDGNSVFEGWR